MKPPFSPRESRESPFLSPSVELKKRPPLPHALPSLRRKASSRTARTAHWAEMQGVLKVHQITILMEIMSYPIIMTKEPIQRFVNVQVALNFMDKMTRWNAFIEFKPAKWVLHQLNHQNTDLTLW